MPTINSCNFYFIFIRPENVIQAIGRMLSFIKKKKSINYFSWDIKNIFKLK